MIGFLDESYNDYCERCNLKTELIFGNCLFSGNYYEQEETEHFCLNCLTIDEVLFILAEEEHEKYLFEMEKLEEMEREMESCGLNNKIYLEMGKGKSQHFNLFQRLLARLKGKRIINLKLKEKEVRGLPNLSKAQEDYILEDIFEKARETQEGYLDVNGEAVEYE